MSQLMFDYAYKRYSLGFTDRLLKPAEDLTLPDSYNVGLVRS
jgi:hypothetical protein